VIATLQGEDERLRYRRATQAADGITRCCDPKAQLPPRSRARMTPSLRPIRKSNIRMVPTPCAKPCVTPWPRKCARFRRLRDGRGWPNTRAPIR
jgi:hypothetical protein